MRRLSRVALQVLLGVCAICSTPLTGLATQGVTLTINGTAATATAPATAPVSPVSVTTTTPVSIKIAIDPAVFAGWNADWWLFAETPYGTLSYVIGSGWVPGQVRGFQGPLMVLPDTEVLNAPMPVGNYTVHFGVDLTPNGQRNAATLVEAAIPVNIVSGVPSSFEFTQYTAYDPASNLTWTRDAKTPGPPACYPGTTKPWSAATGGYIACLNSNNYLGHNDWRAPSLAEMNSTFLSHSLSQSLLASMGFTNVQDYYWTSTLDTTSTGMAMFVSLRADLSSNMSQTRSYYVWPVRTGR